ncbi:MAG: hypothetical protein CL760_12085 [Chloroflexi bacterium]|nr:hypothetical protein [Chloroflexota bacterium]|tara:strand:- start:12631 stop:13437 length:807 start_codon:yes stop_codon:yes gene_type:complete
MDLKSIQTADKKIKDIEIAFEQKTKDYKNNKSIEDESTTESIKKSRNIAFKEAFFFYIVSAAFYWLSPFQDVTMNQMFSTYILSTSLMLILFAFSVERDLKGLFSLNENREVTDLIDDILTNFFMSILLCFPLLMTVAVLSSLLEQNPIIISFTLLFFLFLFFEKLIDNSLKSRLKYIKENNDGCEKYKEEETKKQKEIIAIEKEIVKNINSYNELEYMKILKEERVIKYLNVSKICDHKAKKEGFLDYKEWKKKELRSVLEAEIQND